MLRVGGATETEVSEKKDRFVDALNATRAERDARSALDAACAERDDALAQRVLLDLLLREQREQVLVLLLELGVQLALGLGLGVMVTGGDYSRSDDGDGIARTIE